MIHVHQIDIISTRPIKIANKGLVKVSIGYVYAIELKDRSVKIGSTGSPERRLKAHKSKRLLSRDPWVSRPLRDYVEKERISQNLIMDRAVKGQREIFNVDFALAVWILEAL
jgi:predicted GIY-YIG superfamily endonuclease